MHEILHRLPIDASPREVFKMVTTPQGLNKWWSLMAKGTAELYQTYDLRFGPGYDWKAQVTKFEENRKFELFITEAMEDWKGVIVGFDFEPKGEITILEFYNRGGRRQETISEPLVFVGLCTCE